LITVFLQICWISTKMWIHLFKINRFCQKLFFFMKFCDHFKISYRSNHFWIMSKCVWFQHILNIFKNCSFSSNFEFIKSLWVDHVKHCLIWPRIESFQKVVDLTNFESLLNVFVLSSFWFILKLWKIWSHWFLFQICSISGKTWIYSKKCLIWVHFEYCKKLFIFIKFWIHLKICLSWPYQKVFDLTTLWIIHNVCDLSSFWFILILWSIWSLFFYKYVEFQQKCEFISSKSIDFVKNCSSSWNFVIISKSRTDPIIFESCQNVFDFSTFWISSKIVLFHQILNSSHLFELIMSNIVWFDHILNHFKKWLILPILNHCKMFLFWVHFDLFSNCDRFDPFPNMFNFRKNWIYAKKCLIWVYLEYCKKLFTFIKFWIHLKICLSWPYQKMFDLTTLWIIHNVCDLSSIWFILILWSIWSLFF
jgi:hypothetical protein